jgi:hypothetical protein
MSEYDVVLLLLPLLLGVVGWREHKHVQKLSEHNALLIGEVEALKRDLRVSERRRRSLTHQVQKAMRRTRAREKKRR